MSVTTYTVQHVSAVLDTDLKEIGSRAVPVEQTITGETQEVKKAITNTSTDNFNVVTFWTDTVGPLTDFDLCVIYSDAAVLIELAYDLSGTPKYGVVSLAAGQCLVLTSDDAILETALTDGSAETTAPIERIRVKNDVTGASADVTANVRMVLYT